MPRELGTPGIVRSDHVTDNFSAPLGGEEDTLGWPLTDSDRAPVPPVAEGSLLNGRYRLLESSGRGGTAVVYRGVDEILGRTVAVKIFDSVLTDLNSVARQRAEMRALAAVNHPNLVAVYDAWIADRRPVAIGAAGVDRTYLVLEFVAGATLAGRLAGGPLPPKQVAAMGALLADALSVVHAAALVHRDVTPANILVSDGGEVKLGDFGLARILAAEGQPTSSPVVKGTAAYMSPEQARSEDVGPPSDIYSLGLVLLECLTGYREFQGEAVTAALARLLRDPIVPAELGGPWTTLLSAMTHADPSRRPRCHSRCRGLTCRSPRRCRSPDRNVGARGNCVKVDRAGQPHSSMDHTMGSESARRRPSFIRCPPSPLRIGRSHGRGCRRRGGHTGVAPLRGHRSATCHSVRDKRDCRRRPFSGHRNVVDHRVTRWSAFAGGNPAGLGDHGGRLGACRHRPATHRDRPCATRERHRDLRCDWPIDGGKPTANDTSLRCNTRIYCHVAKRKPDTRQRQGEWQRQGNRSQMTTMLVHVEGGRSRVTMTTR